MIYLSFKKYGIRAFKEYKLYIFAIVVLGIPYGYFRWLGTVAEQKFVEGIGTFLMLPNFLTSIFKRESQVYLYQQFIYKVITLPGIILLAAWLIINFRKKVPLYNAWLVSAVLHVIFVDSVIHLDYYLMFITPVIAVFGGVACAKILENRRNTFLIYAAVSVIVLNSIIFMKLVYGIQNQYIEIGNFVSNHTEKGSLIIIDRDSPELFYTSGRKGWRLYGNLLTEENIKKYKGEGAEYLVLSLQKPEGRLKDYLDSSFQRVSIPGGYTMYKLRT
jgi:hypothetical protein